MRVSFIFQLFWKNPPTKTFFLLKENRKKYPRIRTLVSPLLSLSESLYKILVLPISQHHTLLYKKYYFLFCVLEILYRNTSFIHSFTYVSDTFMQSKLPKGITYIGADASQGCLIKHLHLCKWYLLVIYSA